jgi:Cof subfamily protein (haloacid dehalogenase superfamily)
MHVDRERGLMKLLVFDIDGTIVDSSGRVPPALIAAWQDAVAAGHKLTLVSGRSERAARALVELFQLTLPYGTWNGARVATVARQVLYEATLPPDVVGDLRQAALGLIKEMHAETSDRLHVLSPATPYWDWARDLGLAVLDSTGPLTEPVYKLTLHCRDERAVHALVSVLRRRHPSLTYWPVNRTYLDVTAERADKGVAVEHIARSVGVDCKDLIVFGDDCNDLAMFRRASYRVAVNPRADEVRFGADECVDGVEPGLTRWLRKNLDLSTGGDHRLDLQGPAGSPRCRQDVGDRLDE